MLYLVFILIKGFKLASRRVGVVVGRRSSLKIVLFGATGRTGRWLLEGAVQRGWQVTAAVRDPAKLEPLPPGVQVLRIEARDGEAIARAIEGQDAVISALGGEGLARSDVLTTAMRHIVAGMTVHGVKRIVWIASAGIDGEIPGPFGWLVQFILRHVLTDHRGAVEQLRQGNFDWTVMRPMGLTDGPVSVPVRTSLAGVPRGGRNVSRASVAQVVLDAIEHGEHVKQDPALAH